MRFFLDSALFAAVLLHPVAVVAVYWCVHMCFPWLVLIPRSLDKVHEWYNPQLCCCSRLPPEKKKRNSSEQLAHQTERTE